VVGFIKLPSGFLEAGYDGSTFETLDAAREHVRKRAKTEREIERTEQERRALVDAS
jgi:hypothetical protein